MLHAISERHKLEPAGEPSLQNAIEMARSSMRFAVPSPIQIYSLMLPGVAGSFCDDQSPADAFLAGDPGHLWLAYHRRPRKHIRNPLIMPQGSNTDLASRALCRNENLSRTVRQNRRYASSPLACTFLNAICNARFR